jgi:hypothetical protein
MDSQSPSTPTPSTSALNSLSGPFVNRGDQDEYFMVPPGSDIVIPYVPPSLPASPVPSTSGQSVAAMDDFESTEQYETDVASMTSATQVFRRAWDVIVQRVPAENILPPSETLDVSVPALSLSRFFTKKASRPVSLLAKNSHDMVSSFLADPNKPFSKGLVPMGMLAGSLKYFVPSSPYMNLSLATESGFTELTKAKTVSVPSESFTALRVRAAHSTNAANFMSLCSDAILVISSIDPILFSEQDAIDLKLLSTTLSLVSRDNTIIQTIHETDLRLLERDAMLQQSSLPEDVRRRCRRSVMVPETTFGPETQALVDSSTVTLRAIMTELHPSF